MKKEEIAIAIDTEMLAECGSGTLNPYFCAVPTGLRQHLEITPHYLSTIPWFTTQGCSRQCHAGTLRLSVSQLFGSGLSP